jgi:hypothetical protein
MIHDALVVVRNVVSAVLLATAIGAIFASYLALTMNGGIEW